MKSLLKKLIPKAVLSAYHLFLVSLAVFWYGHPSRELRVIGVTGTKGKSTTCFFIAKILKEAGYRVALSSTALFALGEREWLNPYKMTMLGRFVLQRFIREAVRARCDYLVLEVSSEGILQHRNRGIEFDVAVFTNLSPEHLEAHGSFEEYRRAKGELFKSLGYPATKLLSHLVTKLLSRLVMKSLSRTNERIKERKNRKTSVVNIDDRNAEYFLQFLAERKNGFTLDQTKILQATSYKLQAITRASSVSMDNLGSSFRIENTDFHLNILGKFNIYNALAAITVAQGEGIELAVSSRALDKITTVPGRVEFIDCGRPWRVIVDYAHEPRSLEAIFETVKKLLPRRIIHVFGPTGGGRDSANRIKLGEISVRNADITIITTDDPYDDDPLELVKLPIAGAKNTGIDLENRLFVVLDRREAIRKSLSLAEAGDLVLITGKGSEQAMIIKGKKIPWDDRTIVREEFKKEADQTSQRYSRS